MKNDKKVALAVAGTLTAAAASVIASDRIKEYKEKKEFQPYGFPVKTEYGVMRAIQAGEKGPQIVLLNGYGSPSPYLEFKPLMKALSRFARVTILEPLGYGCAENPTRTRSVQHIVEELDAALNALKLKKVWLMPHSIAGIYALAYVNTYPEKVDGILAIDPSHPEQIDYFDTSSSTKISFLMKNLGLLRFKKGAIHGEENYGADYNAEELRLMRTMYLWHNHDIAQLNEAKMIRENMNTCRTMGYPNDLPVLMMLASENVRYFEDWWLQLHDQQISTTNHGKMTILKGNHFLYLTQSQQIAEASRKFIRETLLRKLEEAEKQLKQ